MKMKFLSYFFIELRGKAVIFIIAAMIAVTAVLFQLSEVIGDSSFVKIRLTLYFTDATLFLAFYWFVRPRWRWTAIPIVWFISIFALANALYFRYWGDMFPLQSMFVGANYNSFVFNSIVPLWRSADFIYLLLPAIVTGLYIWIKPQRRPSFTTKFKITVAALTVLLFVFTFIGSANSMRRWHEECGRPGVTLKHCIIHRYDALSTQTDMWNKNGLTGYLISQIVNYPKSQAISLTNSERQSIAEFIANAPGKQINDSILATNRGKNLIFIIVESLNSWTIGKTYGQHNLTPVLDSLATAEGSISNLRMISQINDGGSSDGQLIYNTGLLPLRRGVAVLSNADNRYPSLAEALQPASSAEFIVESASVYNHRRSSKAFGYDAIYDKASLAEAGYKPDEIGGDDAVLSFAFNAITDMPQPFFAEITTLSMHYPFDIYGFEPVEWIDSVAPDDYYLNHYLQTVHYTDAAIGRFLDRLAASPLADNTIVIIASDHDESTRQRMGSVNPEGDNPIVFIALGSGKTLLIDDSPMAQADVFPTILDIMGVSVSDYPWRGVGRSILSPERHTAAISRTGRLDGIASPAEEHHLRRAFEVSDTIIRSNYFAD